MSDREIRIGTRGSTLALAQARLAMLALERVGAPSRLVLVETAGDRRDRDTPWGEGAFVTAIEAELIAGRVDIAVHSAKDMPTAVDPRLHIAAFLPRADPRDALVIGHGFGHSLDSLSRGARVGTDSPRRAGFLMVRRPDLRVGPLHGNVDTRLRRLDDGEAEAIVLACAGLDRLGLGDRISERLDPGIMPPAPGQGAMALQVRSDDPDLQKLVAAIDDPGTRIVVETERAFLASWGGGCRTPIGALATLEDGELTLLGALVEIDGSSRRQASLRRRPEDGAKLAMELAARLRSGPGDESVRDDAASTGARRRVLVTRSSAQSDELVTALWAAGLEPISVPAIEVDLDQDDGGLDRALRGLGSYTWVVVTSANGALAVRRGAERLLTPITAARWAVIGQATRDALERDDVNVDFQPTTATSAALVAELPFDPGARILVVRGNLAGPELPAGLRARGAVVDDVIAYRTTPAPEPSGPLLRDAFVRGVPAAIAFTSGSTVVGLMELARQVSVEVLGIPAICIGPETAALATSAGFQIVASAPVPTASSLAATVASAVTAVRPSVAAIAAARPVASRA